MILVTGGTGFLGSTLIKQLTDAGKAVMATKRPSSTIPEALKSSSLVEWVDADVTDYFALSDILPKVKQVYHCAAKVSYQKEDAAAMQKINIEGTQHIVNLCLLHHIRLVHVSSIAALGSNKTGLPVSETDKWEYDKKISRYALSKYKSELEVWRGMKEGLDAIIVNPSVIMGLGSYKKGSGAIFELVNNGIKIYPPGSVGIVDVEDVARIMMTLMDNTSLSGERYILNSENLTNKDLMHRIASLLNKKKPSIQATPFMLGMAWRAARLVALFKGGRPSLTKESTQAAAAKLAYANDKIVEALGGYSFKPVDQTLEEITNTYYR
ncbi:NAD-dependent epimerase/dehydratase family protein [Sphingobacterium sp. SGG-5]|uniref:NAD-dependent epimerase/dehydratase family protein n=1 Tax=Sphingobacterium sp. SGG-5 TaxID=2710881 RepID=UPI0013EBD1FE|nr:NAD-dependent epimerase/dehydratase family protein [Sphingobacterium sp. SGG-5]NGM60707.1 NAD-dependent epimerase/dehydratase family protein [Sphingobacterium sp. SGG-5]